MAAVVWKRCRVLQRQRIATAKPVTQVIDARPNTFDAQKTVYSPTCMDVIMEDISNVSIMDKVSLYLSLFYQIDFKLISLI